MAIPRPTLPNVHISYPRKSRYFLLPDHTVQTFFGMNTVLTDLHEYPDGYTPDSINWITGDNLDHIELRRGYHLLGQTRNTGAGAITGLGIGMDVHGNRVPFFAYGTKLKYYNKTTNDTVEIGSNLVPSGASSDVISIVGYQNMAGYFVYVGSPNMAFQKIPVSNPTSAVAQGVTNYKGNLTIGQSRAVLFNRKDSNSVPDVNSLYMSHIDKTTITNPGTSYSYTGNTHGTTTLDNLSSTTGLAAGLIVYGSGIPNSTQIASVGASSVTLTQAATSSVTGGTFIFTNTPFPFAQTTNEAVGSSGSTTYNYTLASVAAPKTCFQVSVTATVNAGTETFTDNGDGTLTSNLGSSGTVNYATGAISVTFSAVTTGSVTASYYTEDATFGGLMDYSIISTTSNSVTTRTPGTGRTFAQFGGGPCEGVVTFINTFYSFHQMKTWQVTVPTNDDDTSSTPASNLPFREQMGIVSQMAKHSSVEGVYFVNNANPARPRIYLLKPFESAAQANVAIPKSISEVLNLSPYSFNLAVVRKWQAYVLVCFQNVTNGVPDAFNSRTLLYNILTGTWDMLDYPSSHLADYNGVLLGGDPLTNNVYKLFDGWDDDGGVPNNYWTSGWTNNGVSGQKHCGKMLIQGLIQSSQNLKIELAFDDGAFTEVYRVVGNGGKGVDTTQPVAVGSYTIGDKELGGGATVYANPFEVEFNIGQARYEWVRVRFTACVGISASQPQPQGGGYVSIRKYAYKDLRYKGQHVMPARQAS